MKSHIHQLPRRTNRTTRITLTITLLAALFLFTNTSVQAAEPITAFPYQDAFGLSILDEKLETIAQDVGINHSEFQAPAIMLSTFDSYGVAVIGGQENKTWLVNHQGDIISDGYDYIDMFIWGSDTKDSQPFEAYSSANGIHVAIQDDMSYLLAPTGEVTFEMEGAIDPFVGLDQSLVRVFDENDGSQKIGVLSDSGELLVPRIYDEVILIDGEHFAVREDSYTELWQVINRNGKTIFEFADAYSPLISHTDDAVYISTIDILGYTRIYNLEGETILSLDYKTMLKVSPNGQYIYTHGQLDDEQPYTVFDQNAQTIFKGSIGSNYGSLTNGGRLSFSTSESFGYIDLQNREQKEIPYQISPPSYRFMNDSNLSYLVDGEGFVIFYDANFEEITMEGVPNRMPFRIIGTGDLTFFRKDNGNFYILNGQGLTLSEDAMFATPAQGDLLYVQESSGRTYLIESTTGKIQQEKN